ncbi:MAG: hypothetical protein MZV70_50305 [Desulfobacterales bacterium]|nr:hypothetical protein [Desulfobacterales bacterium]
MGEGAIDAIVEARQERPFASLFDFCERVDLKKVNKRVVESLIKCGAFDTTGAAALPDDGRAGDGPGLRPAGAEGALRPADGALRRGRVPRSRSTPRPCPTSRNGTTARSWPSRRSRWAST